jgi:hypothetical protein
MPAIRGAHIPDHLVDQSNIGIMLFFLEVRQFVEKQCNWNSPVNDKPRQCKRGKERAGKARLKFF